MKMYKPIEQKVVGGYHRDSKVLRAEVPGQEAVLAMDLIAKWGIIVSEPDGEDSAGRARLRLQTSEELVHRAVETSEAFFRLARGLGWFTPIPLPDEGADVEDAF